MRTIDDKPPTAIRLSTNHFCAQASSRVSPFVGGFKDPVTMQDGQTVIEHNRRAGCKGHLGPMGEKALIGSSYWLLACNRLTVDDENSVRLIQRHERIDIACVECV